MTMEKKWFYLWLSHLFYFPNSLIRSMLSLCENDPEALFSLSSQDLQEQGILLNLSQISQYDALRNEAAIADMQTVMEKQEIHYVSEAEEAYPERLRLLPDPPLGLFYKGDLPDQETPSCAIIGSRTCTSYGKETAYFFGRELCAGGVNVISGMASGVDGYSQRGAVSAASGPSAGRSYAVLAGGADHCYPRENVGLYRDLSVNGHGVLSEKPPLYQSLPRDFPIRNRIIAGLCDVLLVIEAAENSGSLITVNQALNQGKDVFALPGRITDRMARGCNELLKNGAQVLTCPEDVLQYLGIAVEKDTLKKNSVSLTKKEKIIYDLVKNDITLIDELLVKSAFSLSELQAVLLQLEIKGLIKKEPLGGYLAL